MKNLLIYLIAFLIGFSAIFLNRAYRLNQSAAISAEATQVLYLDDDTSIDKLPDKLDQLEVEYDADDLQWAASILGWSNFRKGRYEIEEASSYDDFFTKLAHGRQDAGNVTIIPGVTKESFAMRVGSQMHFDADDLLDTMEDPEVLEELEIEEHLLFGRMLPDTYQIYWTTSPEAFIRRLLREFEQRVTEAHKERMEELGKSTDEIVTLASIIEGESNRNDEKAKISGLYWNRLNNQWRLQADPTVNYAVGERRRLTYADYRVDHPYNTYNFQGLPPGPINNPSYSSIRAALYPDDHDYYYMVATPEGNHAFSETYAEHRRKSREWTEWLREQRRERDRREAEAQREIEQAQ